MLILKAGGVRFFRPEGARSSGALSLDQGFLVHESFDGNDDDSGFTLHHFVSTGLQGFSRLPETCRRAPWTQPRLSGSVGTRFSFLRLGSLFGRFLEDPVAKQSQQKTLQHVTAVSLESD
ncbi:hypothetical protein LDENG_00238650 [Lucifuga dentata]|nr:hypothetical protein LDENG_00238650 [Lucifuga dentata]